MRNLEDEEKIRNLCFYRLLVIWDFQISIDCLNLGQEQQKEELEDLQSILDNNSKVIDSIGDTARATKPWVG